MKPDYSWNARIFVSVDLVGSTAYKVREAKRDVTDWALFFREFFLTFPDSLDAAYLSLEKDRLTIQSTNRLKVWKFNGDEILFVATLLKYQDALAHLIAVKRAITDFSVEWHRKLGQNLALKGTAWFAGFPVANREIELKTTLGTSASAIRDFIGPSMDLGFRLTRFATSREFPLSADLAFLVARALTAGDNAGNLCMLFHKGRHAVPGAFQEEGYPVLWMDMQDGKASPEDRLLGINRTFGIDALEDMMKFLTDFLHADHAFGRRRPFIVTDPDPEISRVPSHILQEFTELQRQIESEESGRGYQASNSSPPSDMGSPSTRLEPPDV